MWKPTRTKGNKVNSSTISLVNYPGLKIGGLGRTHRWTRSVSRVSQVRVSLTTGKSIAQMFAKCNSEKGGAASSPDNTSGGSAVKIL